MLEQLHACPTRLVGTTLFLLALCAPSAPAQTVSWCIDCTGAEANNNSPALAYGLLKLDTSNNFLTWQIGIMDLAGNQTTSHLHSDTSGGGIEVDLGGGNPLTGQAPLTVVQVADLMGGNWYINIHSQAFPMGEVKGQVDDICSTTIWCVEASGSEEVPPSGSNATASGTLTLDPGANTLSWNLTHQGLTGAHTATHLHGPANIGQNGGIQVNLGVGNPLVGSVPTMTATQILQLRAGLWYVNFHTTMFPAGEIRGQIDDFGVDPYCSGLPNSFSIDGARLFTQGDLTAANNSLVLNATGVPPGKFGFLLVGLGTGVFNPPGTDGALCLTGKVIGRYNGQVMTADNAGNLGPFVPDIQSLPNPPGGAVMAGETWNFQTWYRDKNPGSTSNFTDALAVTFK